MGWFDDLVNSGEVDLATGGGHDFGNGNTGFAGGGGWDQAMGGGGDGNVSGMTSGADASGFPADDPNKMNIADVLKNAASSGGGGGGNLHDSTQGGWTREQYRDAWYGGPKQASMDDLQKFVQEHGGTIVSGNGTVRTPYGEEIDMLAGARGAAAGGASATRSWGGAGADAGPSPQPMPSVAPQANLGGGGGGYGGGGGGGGSYGLRPSGSFDPFVYDAFKPPTEADMLVDPSYQFRLKQGTQALTNSAAARGLLSSGAFAKGLSDYGQGAASQEYQNIYGRALNTNQANNAGRLGAFNANTNAQLGYGNLDLGYTRAGNDYSLGQGQLALGNKTADQNYQLGLGGLDVQRQGQANSYALGQGNLGLGWANYGLNRDTQNWNQGYSLADMGLRAASALGNYGGQYGDAASGLYTGQGNANAAGQVGAGNAWNQAFGNIGNAALGAYGIYEGSKKKT